MNANGRNKRERRESENYNIKEREITEQEKHYYDYSLVAIIILLLAFGLVILYSISSYTAMIEGDGDMFYFWKQVKYVGLGLAVMFVVSKIPYHLLGGLSPVIYFVSIGLMALVPFIGIEAGGAKRWLNLPVLGQFQPSELAKLAVILFIPYMIARMNDSIDKMGNFFTVPLYLWVNVKTKFRIKFLHSRRKWFLQVLEEHRYNWFLVALAGAAIAGVVVLCTSNLSTGIIVGAIALGILCIVSKGGLFCLGVCLGIVGGALYAVFVKGEEFLYTFLADYQVERIMVWVSPESYSQDGGYQVLQGLYAIGSGGLWGKGLGNGTQKLTAIPEVQNDYILAAMVEELGIFGAGLVILLFILLLYRLFFIAENAPDIYGSLVVSGIFIHIAIQVIFNIAVVTAIFPNTGVTLPFISYGGTAMLFLLIEIGIALQVSSKIKMKN